MFFEVFVVVGVLITATITVIAVYDLVAWIVELIRHDRDQFRPIGDAAPPPPRVSPFATPAQREDGGRSPAAGEVNT